MPTATYNRLREELAEKRKQLNDVFAKYPEMDMKEDVVTDIRTRNEEINALAEKFEAQKAIEDIAEKTRTELAAAGSVKVEHPGSDTKAAQNANKEQKTFGKLFVESAAFKTYQKADKKGVAVTLDLDAMGIDFKTLLTETGFAPQAVRIPRIVEGVLRRPVIADLLPQSPTSQNAIVYMEETTTTNAAATVAEGAAKPESALAFTERTSAVRKIATVLPVTDELLDDVPAMEGYVESRLRLFLALAEEAQLFGGDGIAPNILGLSNASGVQTQAKGADPVPDAVYKAITLISSNAFLDASGVIFHPLDWQDVRLLRTVDGIYIWGSPSEPGPNRIWGLPVVVTTAATQNTALVGAFDTCAQIFRKNEISFAVSDQHSDFFTTNKLMLRVEERLALAIYRGSALCKVTGI